MLHKGSNLPPLNSQDTRQGRIHCKHCRPHLHIHSGAEGTAESFTVVVSTFRFFTGDLERAGAL